MFIKSVSGFSSFVDFLVFYQKKQPTQNDIPFYAIEETKIEAGQRRIDVVQLKEFAKILKKDISFFLK